MRIAVVAWAALVTSSSRTAERESLQVVLRVTSPKSALAVCSVWLRGADRATACAGGSTHAYRQGGRGGGCGRMVERCRCCANAVGAEQQQPLEWAERHGDRLR